MKTGELIEYLKLTPNGEVEIWFKLNDNNYRFELKEDMLHRCYSSACGDKLKIVCELNEEEKTND